MSKAKIAKGDIVEVTHAFSKREGVPCEVLEVKLNMAKVMFFPEIVEYWAINNLKFVRRWINY